MEQFDMQYGGIVNNIPIELDMTSRSKVMRIIDHARAQGDILRIQPYQKNALFRLNSTGFKMLTDGENQDVLVRMPLHQVASVSYLYEDEQHIISIKYGEVDLKRNYNMDADEDLICHMVVAFCDSKKTAVTICNSVEQFFEETFTKERIAAFSHLNINDDLRQGGHPGEDETESSLGQPNYSFLSNSCKDLSDSVEASTIPRRVSIDSHDSCVIPPTSSSQLSNVEQQLIMDYMQKLYNVLDAKELEEFAKLVKAWHNDLTFNEFCSKLLILYGPDKKYLLSEMRPFIPAKDYPAFETFLQKHVHLADGEAKRSPW